MFGGDALVSSLGSSVGVVDVEERKKNAKRKGELGKEGENILVILRFLNITRSCMECILFVSPETFLFTNNFWFYCYLY